MGGPGPAVAAPRAPEIYFAAELIDFRLREFASRYCGAGGEGSFTAKGKGASSDCVGGNGVSLIKGWSIITHFF